MPNYTENYNLKKPLPEEFYNVEDQNENMDLIDAQMKAMDGANATEKTTMADADTISLNDSSDSGKIKKITWENINKILTDLFAAKIHKHGKSDITDFPSSMTPSAHASTHKMGGVDPIDPLDIGAARIATGSYVGTGTYGSTNPNSLTFDFDVQYIVIQSSNSHTLWYIPGNMMAHGVVATGNVSPTASYSNRTMSWYAADATKQFNSLSETYRYIVIG